MINAIAISIQFRMRSPSCSSRTFRIPEKIWHPKSDKVWLVESSFWRRKAKPSPLQPWILPASRCDISALAGWNGQRIIWVSLRQRKTVPIPVIPCWPMDGDGDSYCNWGLTVAPSFISTTEPTTVLWLRLFFFFFFFFCAA
jgi:hypothetical protein